MYCIVFLNKETLGQLSTTRVQLINKTNTYCILCDCLGIPTRSMMQSIIGFITRLIECILAWLYAVKSVCAPTLSHYATALSMRCKLYADEL